MLDPQNYDLKDLERLLNGERVYGHGRAELSAFIPLIVDHWRQSHAPSVKVYHDDLDRGFETRDKNQIALSLDMPLGRQGMEYLTFDMHLVRSKADNLDELQDLTQKMLLLPHYHGRLNGRYVSFDVRRNKLTIQRLTKNGQCFVFANEFPFVARLEEEELVDDYEDFPDED